MKVKYTLLILIITSISLFLLSCIRSHSTNDLKEIRILPNLSNDKELIDLIKKIEIIPLETNDFCLLDFIYCLKHKDDKFYIQTVRGENPLYVFSNDGSHYKSIGKQGRGPEEFLQLTEFLVDERITLYSNEKILYYSLDGTFLNEDKPKQLFTRIIKIDDNLFALHFGIGLIMKDMNTKMTGTPSGVVLADSNFNLLSKYEIRPDHRNKIGYHANFFSKYNEIVYYRDNYESTIFSINKNEIKPEYYLNFGKYQTTDEFLMKIKNEHPIEYVKQIQNRYATFIMHYHNDKYIWVEYYLNFNDSFNPHFAIFSNAESSTLNFNLDNYNPLNRIFSRIVSNDDNGRFIFSVNANEFLDISESIKGQVEKGTLIRNEFIDDILAKSEKINEGDNPVLILLTLK
jgi:hypothetical protein